MPHLEQRFAYLLFFAVISTTPACAWWQAPSVDDGVTPPADVIESQSESVSARIALTETGLWALVWETGERRDDIGVGDIVRARAVADASFEGHFAVAMTRNWGMLLQRLEGGPVALDTDEISLSVVTPEQVEHLCAGDAEEWPSSDCFAGDGSAAWDIYAGDEAGFAAPPPHHSWKGRMPFRRLAVAVQTELTPDAIESTPWRPDGRWIAVRRNKRRLPNYAATIVADEACQNREPALAESGLAVRFADVGATRDAIELELAAATHRADTVVRCPDDGSMVFLAPVAFRPSMQIPYSGFRGVPLLGWRPLRVEASDGRAVALASRATASIASGHYDRADFYVEQLLSRVSEKRARRLALLSASIAAAAELPEHALRRLEWGGERMWNPERDIAFQFGRAWAWAAFDRKRRAIAEMKTVDELVAQSRAAPSIRIWRAWSELRAFATDYSRRSSAEDGFRQARAFFEDMPGTQNWREAVDWLRWSELGGPLPDVRGADERYDVFRAAALGEETTCQGCRLDPFGLDASAWTTSRADEPTTAALEELARLPLLAIRPGLTRLAVVEASRDSLPVEMQVGLVSLSPPRGVGESLEAAVEALGSAARCEGGASKLTGRDALARLLALRAAQRGDVRLATAYWIVTDGLRHACSDPSKLVHEVIRRTEDDSATAGILARFTTHVLAASYSRPLSDADARRMAVAAKAGAVGEVCMLWNQAAALAALRSGRTRLADEFVRSSVDCHDGAAPEDLAQSEVYLGALVHYERTRRVPGGLPEAVERRLAIATRHQPRQPDACAGLSEGDYWMSAGVSRRVAHLSELIDVPRLDVDEGLTLQTASQTAHRAAASFDAARRALSEGRPALAAGLLKEARRDFAAVAHAPGLARTGLVIDEVYGDDFETFVEADPKATPGRATDEPAEGDDAASKLRAGRARELLESNEDLGLSPSTELAAAVISGRDERMSALVQTHDELRDGPFCRVGQRL